MVEVSCALIVENGKVLIARRSKAMPHSLKWEFPGGKIREGEDGPASVVREIREELGLFIVVDRKLQPHVHHYSGHTVQLHPFVCHREGGRLVLNEHDAFRWISAREVAEIDWLEADVAVAGELAQLLD
ncbi:MAG: hypothetical protein CSA96_04715 [Bacteroidetes bacterium]|nr:MAG: hypothetical protein CSA96_04715 [Bacteroidota bacterium]